MSLAPEHDVASRWLMPGKQAAICFTIDDVHPGKSSDAYEAGGDLGQGALGHVEWLCHRHPQLRVTLFVTPDWREISPFPTRKFLSSIPFLKDRVYLTGILPVETMRRANFMLDRDTDKASLADAVRFLAGSLKSPAQ